MQRDLLFCPFPHETVAIPLERVISVVEGGPVTPLPYTAASFEGLVEAIGQVMPQVDLGALLGLETGPGGILVVVSHLGGSLALRVPRVSAMASVDVDDVVANADRGRERHALFLSEIEYHGRPCGIVDLDEVASAEQLNQPPPEGAVMLAVARERDPAPVNREDTHLVFLMIEIAGERYAIRNSAIGEINLPHQVRSMPGAPDWLSGLIDLRRTPLAVVSMAALLGRPAPGGDALPVCLVASAEPGLDVALAVDRALGLERVLPSSIHPMPQSMAGVESYFVLGADEIVGIIDLAALLNQVLPTLRGGVPQAPGVIETVDEAAANFRHFLTLGVRDELFGLALDRIERIQASVRLSPLPETMTYFDGLADVGDAVVPVIDLNRQFEAPMPPLDAARTPPCILVRLEGSLTGLLVDRVLSIFHVPADALEPVVNGQRLPISHVLRQEDRIVSILSVDRLLPARPEHGRQYSS